MKIIMKHDSGVSKEVKVGFSWTTFFFGFIVPLVRGDVKWALIMFVLGVIASVPTMGIGGLVCDIIFAVIYNKIYIKDLLMKGYQPANEDAKNILAQNAIISA